MAATWKRHEHVLRSDDTGPRLIYVPLDGSEYVPAKGPAKIRNSQRGANQIEFDRPQSTIKIN